MLCDYGGTGSQHALASLLRASSTPRARATLQRERAAAVDIHRLFQRDLVKARLATARALVKVLTDGQVRQLNRVESVG